VPDFSTIYNVLATATAPEEVFGPLSGDRDAMLAQMKRSFRKMALVIHPDHARATPSIAEGAFQQLEKWRQRAEDRIRDGTYGTPIATPARNSITTRRGTYALHEIQFHGDYYTLYRCTRAAGGVQKNLVFKLAQNPTDNDLLEHEAEMLGLLSHGKAAGQKYFPEFVDAFLSPDGSVLRRAIILGNLERKVRLTDLQHAYPSGLDPRDAAWIFNRLLEGLWFTHQCGLVQAAVLPPNLYIDTETHGLVLGEWAFAVKGGMSIPVISDTYAPWYPSEVLSKAPATPAVDIFMAVRCLVYLLGGDPVTGNLPRTIPSSLQRFIRGSLIPAPARRPSDAGDLRQEFDECLQHLYGKRTFRPLAIPI
jgi:serine/threonine protein kinase